MIKYEKNQEEAGDYEKVCKFGANKFIFPRKLRI